ncbi:methyltransferase [Actinomycetota bacterium]|nr:methyltransferase [Actinomycetota bacterium]
MDNNSVSCGDCLVELKSIADCSIDLIYLDPPFFTQKEQRLKDKSNNEYSFQDKWDSMSDYCSYLSERLTECRRVLKETGSIFLHCDRSASHYLRIELEKIYGAQNFQSEIIWSYKRWSNSKKGLLNAHQNIYFFSKSDTFKFNEIHTGYSETTNIDQTFQKRVRNESGKTVYSKNDNGDINNVECKRGVPLSDVWEIPFLNPKAKERVGYPTQKPIILLEQIIKLASNEGDLILDPFCGSGTTLVAAKLLGRNFIGIDSSKDAVALSNERLQNPIRTESNVLKIGRRAYQNQDEDILDLLQQIQAEPVQRNRNIDGFIKHNGNMLPVPVKIQRQNENLYSLVSSLNAIVEKNNYRKAIILRIANQNEQSLIPDYYPFDIQKSDSIIVIDDVTEMGRIRSQL